ncbi:hypothetical protein [Flavobacterium luteolum]|uniref:hypothetical protein n=1 Tax=Flavobacterium luteolum TaxID=3003259 RepID=UPI00248E6581|nr:hypothetical protein [Flavobacterium luteolum]
MNLKVLKLIAIISFLVTFGVQENGVPNFILLIIYFCQFLYDLFNNTTSILWQGLITIPTSGLLVLFLRSKNYKILLGSFIILLLILVFITGLIYNYHRINIAFLLPLTVFVISSVYLITIVKKQKPDIKVS